MGAAPRGCSGHQPDGVLLGVGGGVGRQGRGGMQNGVDGAGWAESTARLGWIANTAACVA